jgi:adenylosuccinate synthase
VPVVAILGAHWGDEGKGKAVAAVAEDADIAARFQGGPNAGHTVYVGPTGSQPIVLRMVPAGVVCGAAGVVGGGCVLNLAMLLQEIDQLEGCCPGVGAALVFAPEAHVISARHLAEDRRDGERVGTTRMGVGPTYVAKARRDGIRLADVVRDPEIAEAGDRAAFREFRARFRHQCHDVPAHLRSALDGGARVVAEGAQGARLDIDHGAYPFVTSCNTTVGAVLTGLGIGPRDIATTLLVTGAYVTKVGGGPFPSRGDDELNHQLRDQGHEVDGATGSVRDCGWLDVSWLRRACVLNQADGLVVTKVDVLAGRSEVGLWDAGEVTIVPGWSAAEAAAPAGPVAGLLAFLDEIAARVGVEVVAVGHGPRSNAMWFADRDRLWEAA